MHAGHQHLVDRLGTPPAAMSGQGPYVLDDRGTRYLDIHAGLVGNQLGHGRPDLTAAAASAQRLAAQRLGEIALASTWREHTPAGHGLAERLTSYAPGDLNHALFTTGVSDTINAVWKLVRTYFRVTGKPGKHKAIGWSIANPGTGRVCEVVSLPASELAREPFATPSGHVRGAITTSALSDDDNAEQVGRIAADRIAAAIESEDPDTVAIVVVEPIHSAGGCFTPPPGYFQRVRDICDEYDVILVSNETVSAFGRLGYGFGAERYDYLPDIIAAARGLTSGYAPLGAIIASDRLMEPLMHGQTVFDNGLTFGGHPVATAVALAHLDALEGEGILEHVRTHEESFRLALDKLTGSSLVEGVRGAGFFYGVDLVSTHDLASPSLRDTAERDRRLRDFLPKALYDAGLYVRGHNPVDLTIRVAPALTSGPAQFDEIAKALDSVLSEVVRVL